MSMRRSMTDVRNAEAAGLMDKAPSRGSALRYMEDPALAPLLKNLIEISSLPLKAAEQDFAADSSGFGSKSYVRWVEKKWGRSEGKEIREAKWVKCHVMCGVKTNIITAVDVTANESADAPYLAPFVETTAKNFTVRDVTADKAYLSRKNLHAVDAVGGTAYIPFELCLSLPVLLDAGCDVSEVQVRDLDGPVEPVQPPLHLGKLPFKCFQLQATLPGHTVHLLVHQPDQVTNVLLGEDAFPELAHYQRLEASGVEPRGFTGPAATLDQGLAHVVGELPALGLLAGQCPATPLALQAAQQVGTKTPGGGGPGRARGSAAARPPCGIGPWTRWAGKAFSTCTGSALSLACRPLSRVPV